VDGSGVALCSNARMMTLPAPTTLVEMLRRRALEQPERRAVTFLADGESQELSLAYSGLDRRARELAASLQRTCRPGARALLLLPPGLDYVAAFLGCAYAGVVAVPVYAPRRLDRVVARLQALNRSAQAAVLLAPGALLSLADEAMADAPELRALARLAVDEPGADAGAWFEPDLDGDSIAFLQYTSGSTGDPKGVVLTHGGLLRHLELIRDQLGLGADDEVVSWLPPYHDMGLIGGILEPLYAGFPVTLLSPAHFLQRPARWLEAVSRTRATVSGGPNFAYELILARTDAAERAGWDLSRWRVAFNGAEPIRADTLARFAEAFRPSGFRRESLFPCYGLAEATLFVSGGPRSEAPEVTAFSKPALEQGRVEEAPPGAPARPLVGCGIPAGGQRVAIVDPHSLVPCSAGTVGEIWVSSPTLAGGYWGRAEETRRAFDARLAGSGEGPFLRTGDLGFLHRGRLFVAGRLKDLVIVRGRNHYPQDLEASVQRSHPALRPGGGAAFSIAVDGEERLVIVHEVDRHVRDVAVEEVAREVRRALAEEHELCLEALALLAPGTLPKTSSGKVQRHACREGFVSGALEPLAQWRACAPIEETAGPQASRSSLEEWLASRLGMTVDLDAPLASQGLDSLRAVELAHALEVRFGVPVPPEELFAEGSVRSLLQGLEDRARASRGVAPPRAGAQPADGGMSQGQRALFFLHRLSAGGTAYNIARAVRVRAGLDPALLRRCFQALVDRHGALRTTFEETDDGPRARVHAAMPAAFVAEDATGWSEDRLRESASAEANRPFDLGAGPLLRAHLLSRAPGDHVLLIVIHHIVADLWSLAVLMDELWTLYAAEGASRALPAPSGTTYADFVHWQQERLEAPDAARLWKYWEGQLAAPLPVLELPSDRPRSRALVRAGGAHAFALDPRVAQDLERWAQDEGATPYMALCAAFAALLHRYTGQEDLVIGSPTSGRSRARFADLVGYCVNPIALRLDLSGDPSFREVLRRVRATTLGGLRHQDLPFPALVERLQPERDPARSPLFQVMFVMQRAQRLEAEGLSALALGSPGARFQARGLPLESFPLQPQNAAFDLTLSMARSGEGLGGCFEYDRGLFDPARIERMAEHFQNLIASAVADPDRRLSELSVAGAAEQQRLLLDWNDTRRAYPEHACIHELVEEQADRAPHAVALAFDGGSLSYGQLEARSNRLARGLRARGVRPGDLVGLAMDRDPDLIVALLAILKSGAAYVPLEASQPQARLSMLAAETGLRHVLVDGPAREPLGFLGRELVLAEADAFSSESAERLPPLATAQSLAYVLFTSGSTGRPKGVAVPHRAVVRLVRGSAYASLGPEQTLLQFAPLAFDASTFEIWGALCSGGRLALAAQGATSLEQLCRTIERHGVTTVWLTAGLFHQLDDAHLQALRGVRQLLAGGDVLSPAQVRRALERLPGCRIVNGYGPTENTTFTCCHALDPGGVVEPVPIGRPIANTRVYVLDRFLQPTPIGVPGELYAGGDGLAWGYWAEPGLTARRFVPDPFASQPGGRLYRTGDLARWREDGTLEFLGRRDGQVKIRGFRVEPGEVESALAAHPGLTECAVVAAPDNDGKRLVAYVVARAGHSFSDAELRRHLQDRVPDYMVPGLILRLSALPLTPSGKLDRRALPEPDPRQRVRDRARVAPRSLLEEVLAGMWAEVLGVADIGVRDDFFELGGHSLRATQIVTRIERTFRVALPLSRLFETPTVAGLAEALLEREPRPGRLEAIAAVVKRVEALSPEEAQGLLQARLARAGGGPA
jgi:amino acid adenylation domain-containing protein